LPCPCPGCGRRRNLTIYGGLCFRCAGLGCRRRPAGHAPTTVQGPGGLPLASCQESIADLKAERARRVLVYQRQVEAGLAIDPGNRDYPVWESQPPEARS
jgi:hypothetical protein